jgi:hypothetical protein
VGVELNWNDVWSPAMLVKLALETVLGDHDAVKPAVEAIDSPVTEPRPVPVTVKVTDSPLMNCETSGLTPETVYDILISLRRCSIANGAALDRNRGGFLPGSFAQES